MVVRKPVANPQIQAAQITPYPVIPLSPRADRANGFTPSGERISKNQTAKIGHFHWGEDSTNHISGQEQRTIDHDIPPSLATGRGSQDLERRKVRSIPAVPQVASAEVTPRSSWESQRSTKPSADDSLSEGSQPIGFRPNQNAPVKITSASSNPYPRMSDGLGKAPDRNDYSEEISADIWAPKTSADGPQESSTPLRQPFAEPWMHFGTPLAGSELLKTGASPHIADNVPSHQPVGQTVDGVDVKASDAPEVSVQSPKPRPQRIAQNNGLKPDLQDSTSVLGADPPIPDTRDSDIYYSSLDIGVGNFISSGNTGGDSSQSKKDHEGNQTMPLRITVKAPVDSLRNERKPPELPPRLPEEIRTNPSILNEPNLLTESASVKPETQAHPQEPTTTRRAFETYQIRLVNWYDASSSPCPRRSPIMVQNANGPCPLLALVNALVLSTPSNMATALVETLRVREQVSLGLLLDAVIDELMSGRRGDAVGILPDVTDLYAFLVTLHTGMNVNPRFVPDEETVNLMDAPIDGDVPTNLHNARKAGGFESTREMKLYGTFNIPLIHGWIPPRNHPAYAALRRSARTYEDAQNVMFREEDLEHKLQQQGLTSEEQMILEDIASVKYFLNSTATQLTGYGLDTITETLAPGSIAILFRNDHFSTLYRHPRSGQLLTLVTDMGYVGHDEVVWESLVDVSGEGCEFFSGDFRPVGNVVGDTQQHPPAEDDSGWTPVINRSRKPPKTGQTTTAQQTLPPLSTLDINRESIPASPNLEQEDHDLALAMQLQEEEEERDRQEVAARRREDELSQAYLNSSDNQGRRTFPGFGRGASSAQSGPSPPPRGHGSRRYAPPTSRPPQRRSTSSDELPPPSYEQAAKGPAYIPPTTVPAHANASVNPSGATPRPQGQRPRRSSAYSEHVASLGSGSPTVGFSGRRGHNSRGSTNGRGTVDPGTVRRRSGGPNSGVSLEDGEKKDKDCVVM